MQQCCLWAQDQQDTLERTSSRTSLRARCPSRVRRAHSEKVASACCLSGMFLLPILNVVFALGSKPPYDRKTLVVQEKNGTS